MQKNTHIHVTYDKVREITQGADENPALFLACLTGIVQKYTNLDITTPAGLLYLHVQFISQSTPDIRRKLRQLEKGPKTPQRDLEVAFKVFSNKEDEAKRKKERERKAKYAFLAAAVKKRDQPGPSHPRTGLKTTTTPTPDPASDATSQDTGQRHAQTRGPPQKHAQPVASGDTERWTVPRDALAALGRSPPPRPGEWNAHRDALAPLGKPLLLPRTPAQPYESCSNDGRVPTPLCPEQELGT